MSVKSSWGARRGRSHIVRPEVNDRPSQKNPPREKIINYTPQWERYAVSLPQKTDFPASQPMRNHRHPELGFSPMDFSFKMTPPNCLLLFKITFLAFICGLAYDFCCSLLVQNGNSLPFLSKPIFAGKITFIFRLDIIWWPIWGSKEDPPLASLGLVS